MALAHLIKERLGHEAVICIPRNAPHVSDSRLEEAKRSGLEVIRLTDKTELDEYAATNQITHTYVFSGGTKASLPYYQPSQPNSYRIANTKHITHVVFRNRDPHGDAYLYVSDWLLRWARPWVDIQLQIQAMLRINRGSNRVLIDSFPHFVASLPEGASGDSLRSRLSIPASAKVIGRIGGFREFSDPAAKKGILRIIDSNPSTFAIFVNTEEFVDHPRIFFLPEFARTEVREFYEACDVLINGRRMGESFGYSIVEPLMLDKPVIAPHWIRNPIMDKNHVDILRGHDLLYTSSQHLVSIYERTVGKSTRKGYYSEIVERFSPESAVLKLKSILTRI
jgi:hypothetical protein